MTGHDRYKVMSNELESKPPSDQPTIYQIRIKGHLDSQWADWFGGLDLTLEEAGNTLLVGPVVDQAALHGLIKKVRDLGMPLISVIQVQLDETHQQHSKKGVIKMNTNIKTAKMDTKILLILLWVFYSLNFMYADHLSHLEPGVLEGIMSGTVADGTVKITAGFLLGTAIMFEIPFLMIVLSWVLKYRANRWTNIIAGTLFIVAQIGSLFAGAPSPAYVFYSTVEIAGLLLIVWYAWKWSTTEG
jgi:hypothetical protein